MPSGGLNPETIRIFAAIQLTATVTRVRGGAATVTWARATPGAHGIGANYGVAGCH